MNNEDIMLLQCQNCGGGIVMKSSQNGVCRHCKSEYFFDTNFSNQVTSMLNEANKDRRMADYDRAISGYQEVLKIDNTNAEAYYGLFISEYGIRFVEENGTFVPTCDRYSSQSVFNNESFQNAIKYAVSDKLKQRYMKEATNIENVRKKIEPKIKNNLENSYDVFICYKKSNLESQKAKLIYDKLCKMGHRVFFAEQTLLAKAGEDFEPIIFTALSTCKMLLLVAGSSENVNSTWVKNEWSRYLRMMKNGEKRTGTLLPICVGGFDPYSLPAELRGIQAICETNDTKMLDIIVRKVNSLAAKSNDKYNFYLSYKKGENDYELQEFEDKYFIEPNRVVHDYTFENEGLSKHLANAHLKVFKEIIFFSSMSLIALSAIFIAIYQNFNIEIMQTLSTALLLSGLLEILVLSIIYLVRRTSITESIEVGVFKIKLKTIKKCFDEHNISPLPLKEDKDGE